ncbi:tetratricopeptide repeat protein 23 [Chanos chanos]|uniref:Tetratricopeptide repeat protein 23 n=1 Tax=Chanos chanos TaxID=29144 RepID=A0A6J2ULL7_CHACN|nr:tetratricopeptide repeat protein 23 [Chanos chanos]
MNASQSKNNTLSTTRDSYLTAREGSSAGSIRSSSGSSGVFLSNRGPAVLRQGDDSTVHSMMTPAEKLSQCDSRAQALADTKQSDACIQDLVRCLALTRLVYGDEPLRLAQAHVRLAKAYLQFKGWAAQAHSHASRAWDLLSDSSLSSSQPEQRVSVLACLLSIHQTLGAAALLLSNPGEAESCFVSAKRLLRDLEELKGITQAERMDADFGILTNLSRVYHRQGRPEEALRQCEKALELLQGGGEPGQTCAVYREMAAIEQAQGHLDRAIECLLQAHSIALSQDAGGLEGAHIAHSLALAYSTAAEPHHTVDSAVHYFEESVNAYRNALGPEDAQTLSVQDDYSRFLLLNGQHERVVEIQRESLALKRKTFGDLSAELADTLQLIGGVEMTQGQMRQAYRTMKKCLDIHNVLYGPQHKKTRETQRTVNMLSQAPQVGWRQRREGDMKTRPPFCSVVPSRTAGDCASQSDS